MALPFLDMGAYSSRPGADDISIQEETDRLLPAVEAIVSNYPDAVISIDTFRSLLPKQLLKRGRISSMIFPAGNLDEDMFATVARLQVPYILMHMKGNPQTMQQLANYEDVFAEVYDYFVQKLPTS
jgi:dihydropteroate synthase